MKSFFLLLVTLCFLGVATSQQAEQMAKRPFLEKLGAAPNAKVVGPVADGYKGLFASWWVAKVIFYYGSLIDPDKRQLRTTPEYYNMYETIKSAIQLDPYNMDAYYFAQATFSWELRRIDEVNSLLKYGMTHRSWDYWLPFYAGFNAAYFKHDYAEGARLMKIAAQRSGNSLFTKLAARYFYQSSQTDLGIIFLESALKQTNSDKLKAIYKTRLEALTAVSQIEKAVQQFQQDFGHVPANLNELVTRKILKALPQDPYGGKFFLDEQGRVESTSKFAFVSGQDGNKK